MRSFLATSCSCLVAPLALAQDCSGETSPVLRVAGPQSSVDTIKVTAGIAALTRPFGWLSTEVKGADIELTIGSASLQSTPQVPFYCTTFYVGPLAPGTYNLKLRQSVGEESAPVTTLVASQALVVSDAGAPLFTNVIPQYPIANEPLSVRMWGVTPGSPSMVYPHRTTVAGDVIRLEGCVGDGGFSVPAAYIAAAGVAPIPAGRYRVEYHRANCDESGVQYTPLKFLTSFAVEVKERGPDWPGPQDTVMPVTEYFHEGLDHYFITADEGEQVAVDSGVFAGWEPYQGQMGIAPRKFGFWRAEEGSSPVCRFFSAAFAPRSSHFYTADPAECEYVKASPDWRYEGIVGYMLPPQSPILCTRGVPLLRVYNNGAGGAPSHRYTTSIEESDRMVREGWLLEGVVGCVPAITSPYRP